MVEVIEAREGFTFGCDPELFILNADGVAVSAEGLLPGTKKDPFKVSGGAVQVDGMAAEFNIDPASTFEEFDGNMSKVLSTLLRMLPANFTLSAVPSITFNQEEWDKAPEFAKELGCSPDFNAWTGSVNTPPDGSLVPRMRTASGHIHIGWTKDADLNDLGHLNNCNDLVKQFDWYLGGWSLREDTDPTRRKLYGKAGACRYKDYGVEYRVLSNFWIMSRGMRRAVWNRMQTAIWDMTDNFMPELRVDYNAALLESINYSKRSPHLEKYFRFPLIVATKD